MWSHGHHTTLSNAATCIWKVCQVSTKGTSHLSKKIKLRARHTQFLLTQEKFIKKNILKKSKVLSFSRKLPVLYMGYITEEAVQFYISNKVEAVRFMAVMIQEQILSCHDFRTNKTHKSPFISVNAMIHSFKLSSSILWFLLIYTRTILVRHAYLKSVRFFLY